MALFGSLISVLTDRNLEQFHIYKVWLVDGNLPNIQVDFLQNTGSINVYLKCFNTQVRASE